MHDNLTALTYHGNVKVKLRINGKLYEVQGYGESIDFDPYICCIYFW